MAAGEDVYCTLLMSDDYLPGAAVLAHSLRDGGTTKKLACLVTQESLRHTTITELQSLYNYVIPVERVGNPSPANLYLMNRPDLLYTFTKIHLWRLVQFRKIVYIDSDVVALRAPEELFDVEEEFAAAPDVGWPDAFNTGVMVISPNMGDYWALKRLASAGDSFDGADQGLLNQYFEHRPWKRLSFAYNCAPSANYQYEPAYRYFKRDIKLVHFIGAHKPWQEGRSTAGAPGAFQELLNRWWAVYDRHFKVSTYEYTATGRREPEHQAIRQEVKTEKGGDGYYATGYPAYIANPDHAPHAASPDRYAPPAEATAATTESSLTEQTDRAEPVDLGIFQPVPIVQQRPFSAPHMDWDATRAAPPAKSRPEASNFPTQSYEFTSDPTPFRPPASYPEPPKDMWYEVPKEPPRPVQEPPPKPIFPWEERKDIPRPTRVFVTDEMDPKLEPSNEEGDLAAAAAAASDASDSDRTKTALVEPETPTIKITHDGPWEAFGAINRNAWDEIIGIEQYVRALTEFQKNRGKAQITQYNTPETQAAGVANVAEQIVQTQQHVLSPTNEPDPSELIEKVRQRRESLILTDFPSAIERPSLPVTPAPRRRSSFFERDDEEDLPPADGVPNQADWNPEMQLEQLRRNSLIGPADLKLPERKRIPMRDMPPSAAPIPEEALAHPHVPLGGGDTPSEYPATSSFSSSTTQELGTDDVFTSAVSDTAASHHTLAQQSGSATLSEREENVATSAPIFSEPIFQPSESSVATGEVILSPTEKEKPELTQ